MNMAPLIKALAVLRWLPPALCGLMAVAWAVSYLIDLCILLPCPGGGVAVTSFRHGSAIAFHDPNDSLRQVFVLRGDLSTPPPNWLGEIRYTATPDSPRIRWLVSCPMPIVLTLLLPIGFGFLQRFRFPLWMWFAWTALFAAECAYFMPATGEKPEASAGPY